MTARPLRALGRAVQALLVLDALIALAAIAAVWHQHTIVDRLRDVPGSVSLSTVTSADHLASHFATASLLAGLATGVVWIVWMYRARQNVDSPARSNHRLGPGWAIGAWFVPLANLVMPYLVMRGVMEDTEREPERMWHGLLAAWWASFVIRLVVSFVQDAESRATLDGFATYADTEIVGWALLVVSAVLAVLVVRRLSAAQDSHLAA